MVDDLRAALGLVEGEHAARLARLLGHLTFARRFMSEARGHYLRAAQATADDGQAARDLWAAAGIAQSENDGTRVYELVVAASERAALAGDPASRPPFLPRRCRSLPVSRQSSPGTSRWMTCRRCSHGHTARSRRRSGRHGATAGRGRLDADTCRRPPGTDDVPRGARCGGTALTTPPRQRRAGRARGSTSCAATSPRRTNSAPGDWACSHTARDQPRAGSEIHDILHMGVENAVGAGALSFALETAQRFADEDLVAASHLVMQSKSVVPLVLMGRFDEAINRGERARAAWEAAGRPAGRWLAPAMYSLVLCNALRGNDDAAGELREFAGIELAGQQTRHIHIRVAGMITFVEARLALHFGRWADATHLLANLPTGNDAWWQARHWYFDAYPWAAAAELAVAAGRPDALARLAAAEPAARENAWARRRIARTRARLTSEPDYMATPLALWEQIGARDERACTLALIPTRLDEARAEFDELGLTMPHDVELVTRARPRRTAAPCGRRSPLQHMRVRR